MQLVGYILLTHGPKHTRLPLGQRPGAGSQSRAICTFAASSGRQIQRWANDYARLPTGPASYSRLFELLERLKENRLDVLILLDDVTRLFRRLPVSTHHEMRAALEPYLSYLADVRREQLLSALREEDWSALLKTTAGRNEIANEKFRTRSVGDRDTTERARRISEISRTKTADRIARQILELRGEIAAADLNPTNVELARIANERGLRTSRGNPWSDVTVGRALKRIVDANGSA